MRVKLHRHARAFTLTLATLASLLLAHASASAETYWLDGYEVEVTLKPERESYVLGEAAYVELKFENRSADDLELMLSGEAGRGWPDDFEMTVTGADGATVSRPDDRGQESVYMNTSVRGTGNRYNSSPVMIIIFSLKDWAKFNKPGLYTVTLRCGVRAGPYNWKRYRISPETSKPAVEVRLQTQVTITRGGDERIGELIEELNARVLACDLWTSVTAATRLAALEDERVVKPLAAAVAKCKNPSIRYTALQALAKFPTDAAFEALRAASADPSEDFRTVVAQVVARNEHPKSAALLLSMRRDTFYGVRLMVLYALEAKDTEVARRIIWEMTNDPHPMVRDEALRFLQQRPTPSRP